MAFALDSYLLFFEIVKLVRIGIFFCLKGTSLSEKPRIASTRKEDYVPVGVRGPIKFF